jgi:hypothetical protein
VIRVPCVGRLAAIAHSLRAIAPPASDGTPPFTLLDLYHCDYSSYVEVAAFALIQVPPGRNLYSVLSEVTIEVANA